MSVPRLAILRQYEPDGTQQGRRERNPRLYRIHQFLSNPDPMKLLELEARMDRAQLFQRPPAGTSGAQSYILIWEDHYIRVAAVAGFAQLRGCGKLEFPCSAARLPLADVPVAVRHVMAGWIRMIYNELQHERVSAMAVIGTAVDNATFMAALCDALKDVDVTGIIEAAKRGET